MNSENAKRIFKAITQHGRKGIGIISLSIETGIPQSQLREYLSKHTDFFTIIRDKRRYTINRFGKYKGSEDKMLVALEEYNQSNTTAMYVLPLIALSAINSSLFLINNR